jgi:hypothetical protein
MSTERGFARVLVHLEPSHASPSAAARVPPFASVFDQGEHRSRQVAPPLSCVAMECGRTTGRASRGWFWWLVSCLSLCGGLPLGAAAQVGPARSLDPAYAAALVSGPALSVAPGETPQEASRALSIVQAKQLRRANTLLGMGAPTLLLSSVALTMWARHGRPDDPYNKSYGCGGVGTPAVVIPVASLALAATLYGIVKGTKLRRAHVHPFPKGRAERAVGGTLWVAAFGAAASFAVFGDLFCST